MDSKFFDLGAMSDEKERILRDVRTCRCKHIYVEHCQLEDNRNEHCEKCPCPEFRLA